VSWGYIACIGFTHGGKIMKTVVVFSGAGLSKESGIPTFRDSLNGLWENYRIEEVASREGWLSNPSAVLGFYAARWRNIQACEPNAAHFAIADLGRKCRVINITQNIDDLLEKAGASDVMHLHGRIQSRKCEWHRSISGIPGDTEFHCDYRIDHTAPVQLGEKCPRCGGQLRPDIVWFGEAVDMQWDYFEQLASATDVFIGVGTSGQVEPAATLLSVFLPAKERYFIDPSPPKGLDKYQVIQGAAAEEIPKLVRNLLS
jgi:NAD-dependent deacetylase